MAADSASGIPLELIALVTPLPEDGGPVPGEIVEHQAHAIGHAAVLLAARGVLLAGDMLSDVLIPLLDRRQPDQVGAYETALDRLEEVAACRSRWSPATAPLPRVPSGGPPRRRSFLHRRTAARRGTGRRASESGLALWSPPLEPGARPFLRMTLGVVGRTIPTRASGGARRGNRPAPALIHPRHPNLLGLHNVHYRSSVSRV